MDIHILYWVTHFIHIKQGSDRIFYSFLYDPIFIRPFVIPNFTTSKDPKICFVVVSPRSCSCHAGKQNKVETQYCEPRRQHKIEGFIWLEIKTSYFGINYPKISYLKLLSHPPYGLKVTLYFRITNLHISYPLILSQINI